MSDSPDVRSPLSPDENLPRVEPPNASFILQLFVVPGVIVLVIVMVWVMFNWLAQMGSDPHAYLEQIRKNNANSWIAAHNLAEELRTSTTLKQNAGVARELGDMLSDLIDRGGLDDDAIKVRVFLCRALGEFEVSEGLPALVKAAQTERSPEEVDVRRSAVEAIALRASHLKGAASSTGDGLNRAELLPTLLTASRDDNPRLREGAAYALGVVGGNEASDRLLELLNDSAANVRFNAATGLAREGNTAASEVLLEMLDADQPAAISEEEPQAHDFKRALVIINALRSVQQLARASPQADLSELTRGVERLLADDLPAHFSNSQYAAEIRVQGEAVLADLAKR